MWPCVIAWFRPDVSRQHSALIFESRYVREETSWKFQPLKFRPWGCLEMLGTNYPATRRHIQEEKRLQLYRCEILKTRTCILLTTPNFSETIMQKHEILGTIYLRKEEETYSRLRTVHSNVIEEFVYLWMFREYQRCETVLGRSSLMRVPDLRSTACGLCKLTLNWNQCLNNDLY
jgi:hypothetical protein